MLQSSLAAFIFCYIFILHYVFFIIFQRLGVSFYTEIFLAMVQILRILAITGQ